MSVTFKIWNIRSRICRPILWIVVAVTSISSGCDRGLNPTKTSQTTPTSHASQPTLKPRRTVATPTSDGIETTSLLSITKRDAPGLHNLYQLTEWLYSGSSPETNVGFESLKELGVKSIVSVDGARPAVDAARRLGLKYIHIPIGYDGIQQGTMAQLEKIAAELPRPIYVHCHHGKHRGPTAAAQILRYADAACTVNHALSILKTLGTDPKYAGLYGTVKRPTLPRKSNLDSKAVELPETAEVPRLAAIMVEIDSLWDELKQRQDSAWGNQLAADPKTKGRTNPAILLADHFREAARLSETATRPDAFRSLLSAAETEATQLEKLLSQSPAEPATVSTLDVAFNQSTKICSQCHSQFRDTPKRGD